MKKKNLVLLLAALFAHTTYGVVEVTLAAAARSKVFDRTSGTLYLGLEGGAGSAISKFYRFSGSGEPTSAGIATGDLSGKIIEYLALSDQGCDENPLLAAVAQDAAVPADYVQKRVYALTSDGKTVTQTDVDLNDATGAAATEGIVQLEASDSHVFAAVRPNGGDFGAANSGIALMTLDNDTAALTIKDATTGIDGNRAQLFDVTSAALKIGANNVTFVAPANENIKLYLDGNLGRLYPAVKVQSGGTGARSVAVARVENEILTIGQIAPDGAFANNNTNIIGTTNAGYGLQVHHVRTMHTSTGPSYLIVNGNVDPTTTGLNSIYALPLVDNTANAAQHGTLARKDSALTNGKFTVPATLNAHLPTINDIAARVGTTPLSMLMTNTPSDIVVVGDTVYVSIKEAQTATTESGIFYSQALFDETGKIIRWTPWSKRAIPFNTFPSKATDADKSRVHFLEIDAINGRLWAIDEHDRTVLATTMWGFGSDAGATTPTTLAGTLNASLGNGCFSVLDLDQSTRGLGTYSPARYALYGGVNKVVFTRVTRSRSIAAPYNYTVGFIPYPQTVTSDFSLPENFLDSPLPGDAGAVVALEYSRRISLQAAPNQCYFFAGAQGGLYVFAAANGAGFSIDNNIDALNVAPFDGLWDKVTGIEGSVIALRASGHEDAAAGNGALYVLTMQNTTNPEQPLISRIYIVPFDVNVATMEANIRLIAQSEVTAAVNSDLANVKMILGMEIISTANDASTEQLVIATNRGLYRSHANQAGAAGIIDAVNQAAALWQPVAVSGTAAYFGIFGIDNALVPTTAWPLQIADEKGVKTYARGAVDQLHGTANVLAFTFVPNPFNSSDTSQAFQTLPASTYVWSDGARRFFIIKRVGDECCRNRLMILPFDATEWCTTSPDVYISDAALTNICSFNWVSHIGATGILMAGIDTGTVALE